MGAVVNKLPTTIRQNAARLYSAHVPTTSCVHRCKLLVVGGGTGGCSVAWRFSRKLKPREIIILDPAEYHYYQPMFTLIAAGIKRPHKCRRATMSVLPPRTCWFRDHCAEFDPERCTVYTRCGDQICYEYMVIAMGIVNNYDDIPGLKQALSDPKSGVSTIYSPEYCCKTWCNLKNFCGGHAVFTYPQNAGKCSGAAQKIMYLADDYWRKHNMRCCTSISYLTGGASMFGVPKYAKALSKVAESRNIATNFCSELVEIAPGKAVFQTGSGRVSVPYNLLHVSPRMSPPEALRCSPLVDAQGYLDVDRHTLQHRRYANIYGLGDCTSTPNSKTAAAVAPQSQVVEANLTATMMGKDTTAKYDGYGSCPLLTSYRRGILAEFKYDKKLCETFPFDQSVERRLFYHMKTNIFPYLYWNKLIKGKWDGNKKWRKLLNPMGRN